MEIIHYPEDVLAVVDFFSAKECRGLINTAEKSGFKTSETDGTLPVKVIFDDANFASQMYSRAKACVPKILDSDWHITGFNDRFRVYRFDSQYDFKWNRDGAFEKSEHVQSKMTFLVYLNDNFDGGELEFPGFTVTPQAGMALVFPHSVIHQSHNIADGVKFVLRSDVLYTQQVNARIANSADA